MDYPLKQRFEAGVHGVLSEAMGKSPVPICEQRFNYLYAMVKDDRTFTDLMERAFRELVDRVFLEFGNCDCPGCMRTVPEVPFESVLTQLAQAQSQPAPTAALAGRCKLCKWCKRYKDIYARTLQRIKQFLPKSQNTRRSSVIVKAPSVLDEKPENCGPYAAAPTKQNHPMQQQSTCGPSTSQPSAPVELEGRYWAELLGDYGPSTSQGRHHGHERYMVSPLNTATPRMTSAGSASVSPHTQEFYPSSTPLNASSMTQSILQFMGSNGGHIPQAGSLHARKDSWDSNATLVARSPSDTFAGSYFQSTNYQGMPSSCEQAAHQSYQAPGMIPDDTPNPNRMVRRFHGASMQRPGTWLVAADEQFSIPVFPIEDCNKAAESDRTFSTQLSPDQGQTSTGTTRLGFDETSVASAMVSPSGLDNVLYQTHAFFPPQYPQLDLWNGPVDPFAPNHTTSTPKAKEPEVPRAGAPLSSPAARRPANDRRQSGTRRKGRPHSTFCEPCGFRPSEGIDLYKKMERHNKTKKHLINTGQQVEMELTFQCEICSKIYNRRDNLRQHRKRCPAKPAKIGRQEDS